MTGIEPKDLLDRIAVDEVAGRQVDLRALHERAGRIRRWRLVGTVLSGAGLAACVALAFALATSGLHRQADPPARNPRPTSTVDGITWTPEPAPAWTPRAPEPSSGDAGAGSAADSGLPAARPSPSPDEAGQPWDRPAYRIPAAAGLDRSEVPAQLLLWEDVGPTLSRAEALRTLEMCEDPNTGYRSLGGPPVSGRWWEWTSANGSQGQEMIYSVTGFAPGTGHARFLELRRYARPCLGSDRDLEALAGRAPGAELFMLASTMTEFLRGGQFVVGLARVGDLVISIQLRVRATRAEAVDLMEQLLPAAMRHLAGAHVPPPHDQWVTPTSSDLAGPQPGGTPASTDVPVPTVTVTVTR